MDCVIDSDSRRLLVLTRRAGKSILIGPDIEVLVVAVATPTVRLEITTRSARPGGSPYSSLVSCNVDERIRVNDRIDLLVRQVRGREARLGIVAPAEVRVMRSELRERISLAPRLGARSTSAQPRIAND